MIRIWPAALMTVMAATAAHAEVDSGSAFRVGLGLDKVTLEDHDVGYDDDTTGFEVFGGWELNRYLAAEAGYLDGGKTRDDNVLLESKAFYASVIGSLWLNDYASLFARGGVLRWDVDARNTLSGLTASNDGNDLYYGVGVAALLDGALLRLEYRQAEIDDFDLKLLSVNVAWRF